MFEILSGSGAPETCLDLNAADDPAGANAYVGGAGTGFKLTQTAGTFSIAGMAAGPQTAGDVAAFLSPRNEMLTVTAGGAFAGIPSCPLPALPTL